MAVKLLVITPGNLAFVRFSEDWLGFEVPNDDFLILIKDLPSAADAKYYPLGENFTQFTGNLWC